MKTRIVRSTTMFFALTTCLLAFQNCAPSDGADVSGLALLGTRSGRALGAGGITVPEPGPSDDPVPQLVGSCASRVAGQTTRLSCTEYYDVEVDPDASCADADQTWSTGRCTLAEDFIGRCTYSSFVKAYFYQAASTLNPQTSCEAAGATWEQF